MDSECLIFIGLGLMAVFSTLAPLWLGPPMKIQNCGSLTERESIERHRQQLVERYVQMRLQWQEGKMSERVWQEHERRIKGQFIELSERREKLR